VVIYQDNPIYADMTHNDYWNIEAIYRIVEGWQREVFNLVMGEKLKALKLTEWLIIDLIGMSYQFVPNPNGGIDQWSQIKTSRHLISHDHFFDDALDAMRRISTNFDSWKVFDSGVSMMDDDDEDTRELEIVGEDDETVLGEAGQIVSDAYQLFKIFVVPRLARMKDMQALVLIGSTLDGHKATVWYSGQLWHIRKEDEIESSRRLYATMQEVVEVMYEANPTPSSTGWQMRQLTEKGVFDTIHTQEWNKGDADGRE
jgi:hypothetical protein